jgi:hypothetical protein
MDKNFQRNDGSTQRTAVAKERRQSSVKIPSHGIDAHNFWERQDWLLPDCELAENLRCLPTRVSYWRSRLGKPDSPGHYQRRRGTKQRPPKSAGIKPDVEQTVFSTAHGRLRCNYNEQ